MTNFMDELPTEASRYIVRLRNDVARYRNQRNEARAEVAQLRAQLQLRAARSK